MQTTLIPSLIKDPPFHRHSLATPFLPPQSKTILDVGGASYIRKNGGWVRHIGAPAKAWNATYFTSKEKSKRKLYSINISSDYNHGRKPDQYYNGTNIPFKDKSYDVVTSIDVFEHMSKSKRIQVLSEMIRVAKQIVIVVFPFYSINNRKMEVDILKDMKEKGIEPKPSLIEHRKYELPELSSIQTYLKNNNIEYSLSFGTVRSIMQNYFFFQNSINSLLRLSESSTTQINSLISIVMDAAGKIFNIQKDVQKKDAYRAILVIKKQ